MSALMKVLEFRAHGAIQRIRVWLDLTWHSCEWVRINVTRNADCVEMKRRFASIHLHARKVRSCHALSIQVMRKKILLRKGKEKKVMIPREQTAERYSAPACATNRNAGCAAGGLVPACSHRSQPPREASRPAGKRRLGRRITSLSRVHSASLRSALAMR